MLQSDHATPNHPIFAAPMMAKTLLDEEVQEGGEGSSCPDMDRNKWREKKAHGEMRKNKKRKEISK